MVKRQESFQKQKEHQKQKQNQRLKKQSDEPFYLQAKKSLGQNFLTDKDTVFNIVEQIEAHHPNKAIPLVEIGPGSGILTKALLEKGFTITAVEKDPQSIEGLQKTLCLEFPGKLTVIESDILKWDPSELNIQTEAELVLPKSTKDLPLLVGNIPYYITSDILLWFCSFKKIFSHGIFMVQDEVADRLGAKPRTKSYGRLSIKLQLLFLVKKLFMVPASCFTPRPKVNSAVVQLSPNDFFFASAEEEKKFEKFCAQLFSSRRKMLHNVISDRLGNMSEDGKKQFWDSMHLIDIKEDIRPDAISPAQALTLFHKITSVT